MDDPWPVDPTPDAIASMARTMLDWALPEECIDGVRSNLILLAEHHRILEDER